MDLPLGLLHVGTILDKEGIGVRIIDAARQPNYKKLISKEIRDAKLVASPPLRPR